MLFSLSSKDLTSTPTVTLHTITFKYHVNQHRFHLDNHNETTCYSSSFTVTPQTLRELALTMCHEGEKTYSFTFFGLILVIFIRLAYF